MASFEVIGHQIGNTTYTSEFGVEAPNPYEEMLTVEVVEESEFDDYLLSIAETSQLNFAIVSGIPDKNLKNCPIIRKLWTGNSSSNT